MRISIGTLAVVGVVALGGLALQACHGALAPVRATPFPADLEYLSPDRLRSSMGAGRRGRAARSGCWTARRS
ncbi:MAG: hypothetical protein R3E53_13295 [Myxococcota bacterium]